MMGKNRSRFYGLLVGTDGSKKMSKSLGNYIGVAEPPEVIYGKTMSIRDDLIMQYFELVTDVPDEELAEFKKHLENKSENPMALKKRLAREIVTQLYSAAEAQEAGEHFIKTVQKKEIPDEVKEFEISADVTIGRLLVDSGLAASRSEGSRLILQGAVSIDGIKIIDINQNIGKNVIIKAGKRRYLKTT
jgi:tyrosyl-tRNA synthetase